RGRGTVMTGRPAPGATALAGEHEGGADVRDRIGGVAVMGEATGEADAAGDAIAFAAAGDLRAGTGRAQIVDAQVERRLRPETAELDPQREARRHVHQADDRAGGDDAVRADDQSLVVGKAERAPIRPVIDIGDAERAAMAVALESRHEQRRIERPGEIGPIAHASRRAVSRTSAIMLGTPWV